jgi:predicted HNH restriction endonuclease
MCVTCTLKITTIQVMSMDRSDAGKNGYENNPKFCLFCGEKIPFEKRVNKFCSQSCAASHNNRGVRRNVSISETESFCSCGNPKLLTNKYCAECIEKRVYQRTFDTQAIKSDKTRKKVLLQTRGQVCEGCGLTEWKGHPIPLDLHHVDGDTDNNTEANLQLLCPNCHAITGTHKRRNKNGKRQQERRQRYADGKTW